MWVYWVSEVHWVDWVHKTHQPFGLETMTK